MELSDAAIRTTLSGQANQNKYFSPEFSVGTYGGGLAHRQHTYKHPCTQTDTPFTEAARIFQLPTADATIITSVSPGKLCQLFVGPLYEVYRIICTSRGGLTEQSHSNLAFCQEAAQLED